MLVHRTEILFPQSAPASAFSEDFAVRIYFLINNLYTRTLSQLLVFPCLS